MVWVANTLGLFEKSYLSADVCNKSRIFTIFSLQEMRMAVMK